MKLMTTVFLTLGVLALSACGADQIGVSDTSNQQGALEAGADEAVGTVEVDEECLAECVEKGENEEDCIGWCSDDKDDETAEWCLAECVEKGESEEDCTQWCEDFDKSDWDDKDECDYDDEDKDDYDFSDEDKDDYDYEDEDK
jgi:hypothetical protein